MDYSEFNFSEALGRSLNLYSENLSLLLTISVLSSSASILHSIVKALSGGETVFDIFLIPFAVATSVYFLIALIFTIRKRTLKEDVTLSQAVQFSGPYFSQAILASVLFLLGVGVGGMLFIIPGLIFFTLFFYYIYFVIFEEKNGIEALMSSLELVKGRFFKNFLFQGMMLLVSLAALTPFVLGFSMLGFPPLILSVLMGLVGAVYAPFAHEIFYHFFMHLKATHPGVTGISVHNGD